MQPEKAQGYRSGIHLIDSTLMFLVLIPCRSPRVLTEPRIDIVRSPPRIGPIVFTSVVSSRERECGDFESREEKSCEKEENIDEISSRTAPSSRGSCQVLIICLLVLLSSKGSFK